MGAGELSGTLLETPEGLVAVGVVTGLAKSAPDACAVALGTCSQT